MKALLVLLLLLLAAPAVAQTSVGCPGGQPVGAIPFSRLPKLRNDADCGVVPLTDAATITTNAATGNVFSVTLGGNRTLASPTALAKGGHYTWLITQDAAGNRTLNYTIPTFLFPGGGTGTLSTAANATDKLDCLAVSTTQLVCTLALAYNAPSDTITVAAIGSQVTGVAFNSFSGLYSNVVPTNVDVQTTTTGTCLGSWGALGGSFSAGAGAWSSTGTITIATPGTYQLCVRKTNLTTTTAISNSFVVTSPSETITISSIASQVAGISFDSLNGSWTGTMPTNVDVQPTTTGTCPGSWTTMGGSFVNTSPNWSSTGLVTIATPGTYQMCVRKTNLTSTTAISNAFTVTPSGCSNALNFSQTCALVYIAAVQ